MIMNNGHITPAELDGMMDDLWPSACPNYIGRREHPELHRQVSALRNENWILMTVSHEKARRLAESALTIMANNGEVRVPVRTLAGTPMMGPGPNGHGLRTIYHPAGTRWEYPREAMHRMERARQMQGNGDTAQRHEGEGVD